MSETKSRFRLKVHYVSTVNGEVAHAIIAGFLCKPDSEEPAITMPLAEHPTVCGLRREAWQSTYLDGVTCRRCLARLESSGFFRMAGTLLAAEEFKEGPKPL